MARHYQLTPGAFESEVAAKIISEEDGVVNE